MFLLQITAQPSSPVVPPTETVGPKKMAPKRQESQKDIERKPEVEVVPLPSFPESTPAAEDADAGYTPYGDAQPPAAETNPEEKREEHGEGESALMNDADFVGIDEDFDAMIASMADLTVDL